MFNVEEWSMLVVFHSESRMLTIRDFRKMQLQAGNQELKGLCEHIIVKLEKMSDEEYATLDFTEDEVNEDGNWNV